MLASMPDQFIPNKIVFKIVAINQDHSKHEEYRANLKINNDKNNHHHIIGYTGRNNSGIFSGCIYININESRQNPYLKFISAIYNLSANHLAHKNATQKFRDEI